MLPVFISLLVLTCAAPSPAEEHVAMTTRDGVTIHGTYYAQTGASAPALLLLHMLGKNRQSWAEFADVAAGRGFAVLAIDFRGHGESIEGPAGPLAESAMADSEFAQLPGDVAAAVTWLRSAPERREAKIALVGASIGANVALNYAATDPAIAAVVLISPGESYRGITTAPALARYGPRPLLMLAAQGDNYSLLTVRALDSLARGRKDVVIHPSAGHGTYLLEDSPELAEQILNFLESQLR